MWYSDLYRRHLLDMHIDDWRDEFLSEFSAEAYVENLKKAQINYAMIYLQSHAGLCYFPTKSGTMHKAAEKDPEMIRRVIDLCHENNIRVCGYYSLFYNTREHDNHPEWRLIQKNKKSNREMQLSKLDLDCSSASGARYGFLCPNNPEHMQFVLDQIDEMIDYFELDALFFDMPFWNHTCFCEHCIKDYLEICGQEIPEFSTNEYSKMNDNEKEKYLKMLDYRYFSMGRFIRKVTDHVKERCPDMPVEHNYASSIAASSASGCGQEVADCCDYVGGDLYGNIYNHSFACKYFKNISKNQPFEQMFSRCKPSLGMHTLTKTFDQMKVSVSSTMAHHGATLVIDAIDPVGTMDARLYDTVGQLFNFQKPYEQYFTGEMVEDIGIYYSNRSKLSFNIPNSRDCAIALSGNLIREHIPFGVVSAINDLSKYKYVIAPMLASLEEINNQCLIDYVKNGGVLLLSGFNNPSLVKELTGHKLLGYTDEINVYVAPSNDYEHLFDCFNTKYPLPYSSSSPIIEAGENSTVLGTITLPYTKPDEIKFASIHSNPPGIKTDYPAVTINNYGKGKVIWLSVPLEGKVVWNNPAGWDYTEYTSIILNLLQFAKKETYSFTSDAPTNVELTLFKNDGYYTVNASLLTDEPRAFKLSAFTVSVKTEKAPERVVLLPDETEVEWSYNNGYVTFKTQDLNIFDMYKIEF